mmetsp:Transcript_11112/g.19612  ORF Transcript_11112/g.19612 Transcript_11112/m.19612 type:complete len:270 (-) Transcript_11112:551-1360(-)
MRFLIEEFSRFTSSISIYMFAFCILVSIRLCTSETFSSSAAARCTLLDAATAAASSIMRISPSCPRLSRVSWSRLSCNSAQSTRNSCCNRAHSLCALAASSRASDKAAASRSSPLCVTAVSAARATFSFRRAACKAAISVRWGTVVALNCALCSANLRSSSAMCSPRRCSSWSYRENTSFEASEFVERAESGCWGTNGCVSDESALFVVLIPGTLLVGAPFNGFIIFEKRPFFTTFFSSSTAGFSRGLVLTLLMLLLLSGPGLSTPSSD